MLKRMLNKLGLMLGKRQRQNRLFAAAELEAEFEQLKQDAPAGAYLFARSIYTVRDYLRGGDKISLLIQSLKVEISASSELANKLDGGLSVLAQQYAVAYLTKEFNFLLHKSTFDRIADSGNRYRDLLARDSVPPVNADARKVLAKRGNTCLLDLINNIATERDELISASPEKQHQYAADFEETKQNLIAWYDVREEAASGKLGPHITNLRNIVACLQY